MKNKVKNFSSSKRLFLKKSLSLASCGLFVSPPLFYIKKVQSVTKKTLASSIEEYTEGKIKHTDVISAKNISYLENLVDPSTYKEVMFENREFLLSPSENDHETLFPPFFYQATRNNRNKLSINEQNNVVDKAGAEWTGGLPFPTTKSAKEITYNLALGCNRHDQAVNAINGSIIDKNGNVEQSFDMVFASQQLSGICNPSINDSIEDKTRYKHLLKYNAVWFSEPEELKGLTFTNKWFKDQYKFPELYSFSPNTRRMTKLANSRRLSEIIPNINFSLSDAYGFGDPFGVWGNWKIVYKGPFLVSTQHNWRPDLPNWDLPITGGLKGQSYYLVRKQYVPNIIVIDITPTGYRNPGFAKKRIYIDSRNMTPAKILYYDQSNNIIKSIEIGYSQLKINSSIQPTIRNAPILTSLKKPDWNWSWYICKNHRTKKIGRFHLAESCTGGWKTTSDNITLNGTPDEFIEKYMTQKGIRKLFG
ncbi:MAG: hypothetical protein CBC29_08705 [Methylococcaceae bacterium TMED69]|nr:MAG: hypothetical protein CBC29_08705 [Methylococcaceae bacterium TMED69]